MNKLAAGIAGLSTVLAVTTATEQNAGAKQRRPRPAPTAPAPVEQAAQCGFIDEVGEVGRVHGLIIGTVTGEHGTPAYIEPRGVVTEADFKTHNGRIVIPTPEKNQRVLLGVAIQCVDANGQFITDEGLLRKELIKSKPTMNGERPAQLKSRGPGSFTVYFNLTKDIPSARVEVGATVMTYQFEWEPMPEGMRTARPMQSASAPLPSAPTPTTQPAPAPAAGPLDRKTELRISISKITEEIKMLERQVERERGEMRGILLRQIADAKRQLAELEAEFAQVAPSAPTKKKAKKNADGEPCGGEECATEGTEGGAESDEAPSKGTRLQRLKAQWNKARRKLEQAQMQRDSAGDRYQDAAERALDKAREEAERLEDAIREIEDETNGDRDTRGNRGGRQDRRNQRGGDRRGSRDGAQEESKSGSFGVALTSQNLKSVGLSFEPTTGDETVRIGAVLGVDIGAGSVRLHSSDVPTTVGSARAALLAALQVNLGETVSLRPFVAAGAHARFQVSSVTSGGQKVSNARDVFPSLEAGMDVQFRITGPVVGFVGVSGEAAVGAGAAVGQKGDTTFNGSLRLGVRF